MQFPNNENEAGNRTPWNYLFRKTKAGDADASRELYQAAQPLIKPFYKVPKFKNRLGRDEIHSIASFALVRYFAQHTGLPPDNEVPYLLKHVIWCELINGIRNMNVREKHERPGGPVRSDGTDPDAEDANRVVNSAPADDREEEPETRCLNKELHREVREAVSQLPKKHQTVINGLYYQQKNMKEIAQEMNCSAENVRIIRLNALARLHQLLEPLVNV
jgi:RNA polymerase sigma factor (sigma-70 family)